MLCPREPSNDLRRGTWGPQSTRMLYFRFSTCIHVVPRSRRIALKFSVWPGCWYCTGKGIQYCTAPRSAKPLLYRALVPPVRLRLRGCRLFQARRASERLIKMSAVTR